MDAIDNLSDAIDTTQNFLTPVDWGTWLRLAVIVFFVSSLGLGGSPMQFQGDPSAFTEDPAFEDEPPEEEFEEEIPMEDLMAVLLVIFVIGLVIWMIFTFIGSIMEFALIESLRSTEVHVRRYFSANVGRGVRLFGFRVGLSTLFGALGLAPLALAWDGELADLTAAMTPAYLLYATVLWLLFTIVARFTSEFVAPIMLLEDRGVLSAWGRFWPTFTANWAEYVVYLVLFGILSLAIGIAASIIILIGTIGLLIPFIIVMVILASVGGAILALPIGVIAFVLLLLFVSLVYTPITTYFRYYALLLLGDTNEELDIIPDQRAAVRTPGGTAASEDRDEYDPWADEPDDSRDASEDIDDYNPWDEEAEDERDDRTW